jgi:hypothetical protein
VHVIGQDTHMEPFAILPMLSWIESNPGALFRRACRMHLERKENMKRQKNSAVKKWLYECS